MFFNGEMLGIEYSKSGRAKCQECYKTIDMNVLRVIIPGTHWITTANAYVHLSCYKFPYFITDYSMIKGYSYLMEEDKITFKKLILQNNKKNAPLHKRKRQEVGEPSKVQKSDEKGLFLKLPTDTILCIIEFGDHYDTILLGMTCKTLYEQITQNDKLWKGFCQKIWDKIDLSIRKNFFLVFRYLALKRCMDCLNETSDTRFNTHYSAYLCKGCSFNIKYAVVNEERESRQNYYQKYFPKGFKDIFQPFFTIQNKYFPKGSYYKIMDIAKHCVDIHKVQLTTRDFREIQYLSDFKNIVPDQ